MCELATYFGKRFQFLAVDPGLDRTITWHDHRRAGKARKTAFDADDLLAVRIASLGHEQLLARRSKRGE
jgi:hypothetical protein